MIEEKENKVNEKAKERTPRGQRYCRAPETYIMNVDSLSHHGRDAPQEEDEKKNPRGAPFVNRNNK